MYNPVIRHLYYLQSDHPDNSSTHLTPCIVIKILLTILPVLYVKSPWPFCNHQIVLLSPFTYFSHPLSPLPSDNHKNSPHIYESASFLLICLFCFLDPTYKCYHVVFVFLCLVSLSTINALLSPFMLLQVARFHSFLWPKHIPLYICTTSSLSIYLLMATRL